MLVNVMKIAFILLNMVLGYNRLYFEELETLPEVKYVYNIFGVYDILVKVECESIDEIKDFIAEKIRSKPDVQSYLTMLVVERFTV